MSRFPRVDTRGYVRSPRWGVPYRVDMADLAHDLDRFYKILHRRTCACEPRTFDECHGRMIWPKHGIYFIYENGELRMDGSHRVVRVGIASVLWRRIQQHRGTANGGNHRSSAFRKQVGRAILVQRPELSIASWDSPRAHSTPETRRREVPLEQEVSRVMQSMSLLYFEPDAKLPRDQAVFIEAHAIALLSRACIERLESPSKTWLGNWSPIERVAHGGLWNSDHVGSQYDPAFLDALDQLMRTHSKSSRSTIGRS